MVFTQIGQKFKNLDLCLGWKEAQLKTYCVVFPHAIKFYGLAKQEFL